MGNGGSNGRRHHGQQHQRSEARISTNQYVFTAPSEYPNPSLPHYHRQYPPPPHDFHRYPSGAAPPAVAPPYVECQKTVTIKNDVNIKKESIRAVEDEENPGKFLLTFTFDATAPGSITVLFFGKEDVDCNLIPTRENVFKPVTLSFEQGIGQKFRQPSGTGIDVSMFKEAELKKEDGEVVYPIVLKAEACPLDNDGAEAKSCGNSQITLAVFDKKEKGEYLVRVRNQILWVDNTRYELQEIYGIGNSVDVESDDNDPGKECVICMSEPRDTTVLPCRHMCMCSGCAKVLQFQTKRCPICRQPVERLLEIKVNNGTVV